MVVRAKKATILKIIKNEEIPVVAEVKAAVKKSGQTSVKNKNQQDKEVGISPTIIGPSLFSDHGKSLLSRSKVSVNKSKGLPVATEKQQSEEVIVLIDDRQPLAPEKVKKILPPIPLRTPAERQSVVFNYHNRESLNSLAQSMPVLVGTVADNLTQKGRPELYPCQVNRVSRNIIQKLLSDPSIVVPTWEVLIDNNLSISNKSRQLKAIGWELEVIPFKGFREMCLLAQILTNGKASEKCI